MSIDGAFLFIGLLVNAIVVLYVTRLQLKISSEIGEIHKETNNMRSQLEIAARAEGHAEGREQGIREEQDRTS